MVDQIFISYASDKNDSHAYRDRQAADKVYAALEAEGIRCWAAHRDILPGDNWLAAIIGAIEKSKILVLIFSSNANQSQWVQDEIKLALEEKIRIIPFRIDDVSPEEELKILKVRCQWLDAFTPPIEEHIGKLVEAVCRHLEIREKIQKPDDIPEDVKAVQAKCKKVYKNNQGFWEADYGDDIIMVYIPPGEFTMGSNEKDNEKPPHTVFLDGYWMGKYEVTVEQFGLFVEDESYVTVAEKRGEAITWTGGKFEKKEGITWKNPGFKKDDNHPVACVSWDDARAYCKWLSHKKGLLFKLPTEAQWEKASRGTDKRKYPWGNQVPNKDLANFDSNIGKTTPVGSYPDGASPYGLLDTAGNVWEWCNDWYEIDYYKKSPAKNPPGPESSSNKVRVQRSGSWNYDAGYLCCAFRGKGTPSYCFKYVGFRLCQDNH